MSGTGWRAAGAALAPLDAITVLLLVGTDRAALAATARGAASVAGERRRVAVFDLAGAFGVGDPDGIVPAFYEGRSLNSLARPLEDGANERFVVPRGVGQLEIQLALHERWPRLVDGFRASSALLILVAPDDQNVARALAQHADMSLKLARRGVDFALEPLFPAPAPQPPAVERIAVEHVGALVAGDVASEVASKVASEVGGEVGGEESLRASVDDVPEPVAPQGDAEVDDDDRQGSRSSFAPLVTQRETSRREFHIAMASIAIVMGLGAVVLMKFLPRNASSGATNTDSTLVNGAASGSPADTVGVPTVVNPTEARNAAQWAVELEATNDRTDANLRLSQAGAVAAKTVTPVSLGDDPAPWYKIVVGAFSERSGAELLRSMMRRTRTLDADAGVVARVPYALRLEDGLTQSAARSQADAYIARGIAAYALVGDDGRAAVYTGAFASPEQAVLLIAELRAQNVESVLAYRIGRTY